MLIKIADGFFDHIFFEFTNFVRLGRSYLLKRVSNLFDLSSYSTYPWHFLYIECTKPKGKEKIFKIGESTYRGSTL